MWTTTPPTRPGTYLARFLPEPGIDTTPFPIEIVEDHFNGGVCARQRDGMCVAIERFYYACEWSLTRVRRKIRDIRADPARSPAISIGTNETRENQ